ncbi:hypothetical protein [Roseateles sp. P5_E7]
MKHWPFLFASTLLLAACGGGGGGASQSGGSSPATPTPTSSIDCQKLDPAKVYMMGGFDPQDPTRAPALADPSDPLHHCLGFKQTVPNEGTINSDGKLIYGQDNSIYQFVPDVMKQEIGADGKLEWVYPITAMANDPLLFTAPEQGCGMGPFKLVPQTSKVVYRCPMRTVNSQLGDAPYDLGTTNVNWLLSALPDGSLLVYTFEKGLVLVDKQRRETVLKMPAGLPLLVCEAARQFTDKATGELKLWVQCYDYQWYSSKDENLNRRFVVNAVSKTVVDEGPFAALPANVRPYVSGKFDAAGVLWQVGDRLDNPKVHVVVKRELKSGVSTLVYAEESYSGSGDWKKDAVPFVRPTSMLITGY